MPAEVLDTLFGTRYHTPGAALQLPRKVPMRVEPKSYFGERGVRLGLGLFGGAVLQPRTCISLSVCLCG
jgi:hypothetical protein